MEKQFFKRKTEYNLVDNKNMIINDVLGIQIDNFRLFENQKFQLGKYITLVSGRNGTMKSTLMGLVAQPYRSNYTDVFGKKMQTKFNEVFNLSSSKDDKNYLYHLQLNIDDNLLLQEPVPLYFQAGNENTKSSKKDRHRLVPSGREKGDGYFNLPSVYINLKRLYPLIDSGEIIKNTKMEYTENERKFIGEFYQKVLLTSNFDDFNKYSTKSSFDKQPYGPGENSYYDVQSISSGEDNLSRFIDVLISFNRIYEQRKAQNLTGLTGLFSIDEFEASLHPIAQANLFDFLFKWSKKHKVKILLNTHSLFLIQHVYLKYENAKDSKDIILNFIESPGGNILNIIQNPDYKIAYRELTLSNQNEKNELLKVKILCEDEVAKKFLSIILSPKINPYVSYSHKIVEDNPGSSFKLLRQLCKNFPIILYETKSIVIVDGDVPLTNKDTFKYLMKLPSKYENAPEKELVRYILELDSNHDLFTNLNCTKEMLKQEFSQADINLNINEQDIASPVPYKTWYKNKDKKTINKIIRSYIRDNKNIFDEFKEKVIENINQIRINNGFGPIEK